MSRKIRVGVVFGGRSGEHEVSIHSARSVIENLNPEKYEILPIGITKDGIWYTGLASYKALGTEIPPKLLANQSASPSNLPAQTEPGPTLPTSIGETLDVIIPVLHGPYGEDGTVQGLFELLDLPYVGAGVLASAVGMDKAMMKAVFAHAGLPQCKYQVFLRNRWEREPEPIISLVEKNLGYPCFVKPANLGSSVGISKARDRNGLVAAMNEAARYDRKIIVEEGVDAREIEVAVLGNDEPRASIAGEIVPKADFYDYNAKYVDGTSDLIIPADLPEDLMKEVRDMAIRAYQAIDGSGLSRVDFFLERNTDRLLINEINTFPGFTIYSMYPKLWEATGISYQELIDELIRLAIERHQDKNRMK
ncbi:D-alanine--D-alanine ligase [Effusibacillus lacus]|uniref:D-alanine--D-alanine ligase n=1 Tax=Effusibacillus lacus TaxID=1348429 RepID=A0A292YL48_9BACL|nr:D-alanine--D-alanine ligase [Effusibacillus lacus]TCS72859.1 D-alanine--D-alanine ligase [Effusibacillus lacus]GAX89215.1 D-alanine--D-alanine ligase A [Effusibacillus lacus]